MLLKRAERGRRSIPSIARPTRFILPAPRLASHSFQTLMRFRGQNDFDVIACGYDSASQNNTHYSDPSKQLAVLITVRDRFFQATLELIELSARIAEPGDFNSRVRTNV